MLLTTLTNQFPNTLSMIVDETVLINFLKNIDLFMPSSY